ncbi:hypothetical protein HPB50_011401 [Hyalomma asiaticum]|uniref:Uncharacterized protein n=1 Tax=Hyalomma asiaticum TaxID=266040 RepID=A0ACB7TIU9_HYAAI|nr:hypothetical protein HPB50_011401 [Hyalomma asiaticum]
MIGVRQETSPITIAVGQFPSEATKVLKELLSRDKALLLTPEAAALVMVGGYLARTVGENIACDECFSFITKPAPSASSDSLIQHQDRGRLLYPSEKLLVVFYSLSKFIDIVLSKQRNLQHPVKESMAKAAEVLWKETFLCSLSLCTATLFFVLSQDRLTMDLDASTLSLMLQLFESDPQQGEGGLTTSRSSSSELIERHREKVQQLCEQMQQKGHAKHLNLNRVNTGTLALETLLSLTSRRAGEWFKEELRLQGGLTHIVNTVSECLSYFGEGITVLENPTDFKLEKLKKIDRCSRVLENSLGLLINLVEHCEENRERLANTQTVGSFESVCDQMEMPAFNALMDLFTDKVEAAHQSEEQANELLSSQEKKMKASLEPQKGEPLPTSQQSALSQADDLEETLMKGKVILRIGVGTAARSVTTAAKKGTLQEFAEFSREVEISTRASLVAAGLVA